MATIPPMISQANGSPPFQSHFPIWLVVWNMFFLMTFQKQLGMSSSQLFRSPSLFRGVGQPPTRLLTIINHIVNHIFSQLKTSIFPASQSALHCLHQDHAKHAAPHAAPGGAGTLRLRLGCVSLG